MILTGLVIAKLLVSSTRLRLLDLSDNLLQDIGIASIAGTNEALHLPESSS